MLRYSKNLWLFIAGALLFLSFFISYDSVSIPEWKVQVVSETGTALPNKAVTEIWHDPLEWFQPDYRTTLISNQDGYVVFPIRKINASLFSRFCGIGAWMLSLFNLHGTSSSYAFLTSPGDGFAMYREGGELKTQIVVSE